jgi:arylsulfatase A-like enzyme
LSTPPQVRGDGEADGAMNVLMIVSDTLRPDYLGFNGGRAATPNLDALARESVYFERAVANSFPTVPTRADYMTGKYSFTDIGWGPLPRGVRTMAQRIAGAGISTAAVVDTPFFVVDGYNYDRGFQTFQDLPAQDDSEPRRSDPRIPKRRFPQARLSEVDYAAPATMIAAERALERLVEQRFFLYVDTWDPHEPWDPPDYYVKKYLPEYDGSEVFPVYGPYEEYGVSSEQLEIAKACYCGEIEMVDRWIGRLIDRLDSLGLRERTAIVVLADHGFYFGEHGLFGKMIRAAANQDEWLRSPLYTECIRVPLIVNVPGVQPRRDPRLLASAINIAPTVLDLFGIQRPADALGRSLLPLVRSAEGEPDEIVLTAMPLAKPGVEMRVVDDVTRKVREWQPITVTTKDWMMLFSRWSDPIELYRLTPEGDAGEENVAAQHEDVVRELHGKLIAELARAGTSEEALSIRS